MVVFFHLYLGKAQEGRLHLDNGPRHWKNPRAENVEAMSPQYQEHAGPYQWPPPHLSCLPIVNKAVMIEVSVCP